MQEIIVKLIDNLGILMDKVDFIKTYTFNIN